MKTIKGEKGEKYFVLFCYCNKRPMICGVYPSKEEAKEVAEEVKGCRAKHRVKQCEVIVKIK